MEKDHLHYRLKLSLYSVDGPIYVNTKFHITPYLQRFFLYIQYTPVHKAQLDLRRVQLPMIDMYIYNNRSISA